MKINAFKTLPILALLAVPLAAQTAPSPYNTPSPDDPNRMNPISAPENAAPPADATTTAPQDTPQDTPMTNTSTTTTTTTEATATPADTTSTEENALPQTAGPLGLLALLAVGSAGSAFGLRKARRQ